MMVAIGMIKARLPGRCFSNGMFRDAGLVFRLSASGVYTLCGKVLSKKK
jgi:hypothetical protein